MVIIQRVESIKNLPKWFVYVTVLCGLLAFSSSVSESRISLRGTVQTELQAPVEKCTKNTIRYHRPSVPSGTAALFYGTINATAFLFYYEATVATRLKHNLEHWISYKKSEKLARTPYTRRSYYEFALNSLRG